ACALAFAANDATAQRALRAEGTLFIKPRVGLSYYHGEGTENFTFGFGDMADEGPPYSLGLELGYQISTRFSISGQVNYANYSAVHTNTPPGNADDNDRWTNELLFRWTAKAGTARIAPFIQGGLHGTDGVAEGADIAIGPVGGVGLDIALTDRIYLFLEAVVRMTFPDESFDRDIQDGICAPGNPDPNCGIQSDSPNWDWIGYIGPGLKINFKSPFTEVDVMSVECPSEVQVGQSATFTSTVNSDVATPPITYSWNWGDGSTGMGSVATKTFNRPGTYTVTFTATNDGASDSESCTVTVVAPSAPPEIIGIDASETRFEVCEPVEVDFEANVRGAEPITYTWDMGDGSAAHTGEETTHTFSEPGTYTVRLTARNADGESTRTITITAEPCEAGICFDITEMNSVFFGRNSSTLTDEARTALLENHDIFHECPNLCARIVGYAGADERNPQQLSEDRARAVEQFYVDNRIAASRFSTEGRGVLPGTTKKEGAAQARRADTLPVQCVDLNR
ncbi:MAG: PKD domain-containing protein, partial [Rhodothermales bacterium]